MEKPKKKAIQWPFDYGQKFACGKNDKEPLTPTHREDEALERYVRHHLDGGRTMRKELSE